jgi:hypothetical protein
MRPFYHVKGLLGVLLSLAISISIGVIFVLGASLPFILRLEYLFLDLNLALPQTDL